jgi:hypothetical protein
MIPNVMVRITIGIKVEVILSLCPESSTLNPAIAPLIASFTQTKGGGPLPFPDYWQETMGKEVRFLLNKCH